MADSTCLIDATAVVTITPVEAAAVSALVSDFNKGIGLLLTQAKATNTKYTNLKNRISLISPGDFTPPDIMDTVTQASLNKAYQSSAWLTANDAANKIQAVKQKCSHLSELGTGQLFEKMKGGVIEKALKDLQDEIEKYKLSTGLSFPEFDIGLDLSDLVNKGYAAYEAVENTVSGAVDPMLESGKGGMAQAIALGKQNGGAVDEGRKPVRQGLAVLVEPLRKLDQIIDCVDGIAGVEAVGKTDQMIDALNDVYDKTGVYSDPNLPNFGEFDPDKFFAGIPGITPDQKNNILKTTNTMDKAKNNAAKAVDKAKAAATPNVVEKSVSSLAGGITQKLPIKKQDVKRKAKVEFETPPVPAIPASPGRPAQPAQPAKTETPTPPTVPVVELSEPEKPQPEVIYYKVLVKDVDVTNESSMTEYLSWDPDKAGYPRIKNSLIDMIPFGGYTSIENPPNISMRFTVNSISWEKVQGDNFDDGGISYATKATANVTVWVFKEGSTKESGVSRQGSGTIFGASNRPDEWKAPTAKNLMVIAPNVVGVAMRTIKRENPFTESDFEGVLNS